MSGATSGRARATGRPKPRLYAALRLFGRGFLRLILDMRVSGLEHVPEHGPVLVGGNHRGFVDGPVVATFLPRPASFLAKSELFVGPLARVLGWLCQIPVHRGKPDREALRRAREVLAGGGVVGVFPEGTRGSGSMEQVQHGIAYLALHAPGCPVVPVACLGTDQAIPRGSWRPRLRSRVDVVFGAPIPIGPAGDPRSRRAVAEAAEQIRLGIAAHVRRAEEARP